MLLAQDWKDYELLDAGNGEKLERWQDVLLRRPDPQAIWSRQLPESQWRQADGFYHRSDSGGGHWEWRRKPPGRWQVSYKDLSFYIEPTGFKHTGLFPEQAANWDWMRHHIAGAKRTLTALNLFAYTGGATVAMAAAGVQVCHVDAARRMVTRAKENAALSGLEKKHIRYMTDDVMKFIQREQRRGNRYDIIVMDPPTYGRGPTGELWKLEDTLQPLIEQCAQLLSDHPLFVLLNAYTSGFSPQGAANLLRVHLQQARGGEVSCGELGLPMSHSTLLLPCGSFARWTATP